MKSFTILALFIIAFLTNTVNAQNLIAVQNGNTPKFFQQMDDAITNSVDGDTIYIPGGSWNITKPINKRLQIVGVGHHPDSTKVTFPTILNNHFYLTTGASNGSLTGIYLMGAIVQQQGTGPINSYRVLRCHIIGGISTADQSNFTYIENIIEGTIGGTSSNCNATKCSFFNNIISALFSNSLEYIPFCNSTFINNIFLGQLSSWSFVPLGTKYSLVVNNIFISTFGNFDGFSNSTANNNLLVQNILLPYSNNVGANNIVNQVQTSIFVNQTGNTFNYSHDYHLQPGNPGKNAGTDGTDIGIYGGIYPWKEGSIPSNPHFQIVKIGPKTDSNGNLNVNIKVAAQDN